jgi:hypothetical protein
MSFDRATREPDGSPRFRRFWQAADHHQRDLADLLARSLAFLGAMLVLLMAAHALAIAG